MERVDPTPADLARVGVAFSLAFLAAWALERPHSFDPSIVPFFLLLGWALWLWARRVRPLPFAAVVAPLALWPLLYDGAVEIVLLAPERFVDGWLTELDARLLARPPGPPTWPLGGPAEEAANLLYASYYVGIPTGMVWLWARRGTAAAARYVAAFLGAFTACGVLWLVLPSGGYHPSGSPTTAPAGPFTALMRTIYDANPHYAAAFPSSHVALSTAAAATLAWYGARPALVAWWPLGIAWATVYGQYHYAVDSPPALAIGLVAWAWAVRAERPALSEIVGGWPVRLREAGGRLIEDRSGRSVPP
jgi:hypothetical protein